MASNSCQIQLDGYCEDSEKLIAVEAYARVGKPASGQKRKIIADIFKLSFLESAYSDLSGRRVEKYLVFACEDSAAFLEGEAWAAKAREHFGVEIHIADLGGDMTAQVLAAQQRQKEGMASGKETSQEG